MHHACSLYHCTCVVIHVLCYAHHVMRIGEPAPSANAADIPIPPITIIDLPSRLHYTPYQKPVHYVKHHLTTGMCMRVCMCMSMCMCVWICMHVYVRMRMCVCMYVQFRVQCCCTCLRMSMFMCLSHVHLFLQVLVSFLTWNRTIYCMRI